MTSAPPPAQDLVPRWGVIHVHTNYSDGTRTIPQVAAAAHDAELDFVLVTDHNTLEARVEQGYHGDVLVGVEVEVTPSSYGRHLIAFGLTDYPDDLHERKTGEVFAELERQQAFGWVPHPRGFLNPWFGIYNAAWTEWQHPVGGLELSTFLVDWAMELRPWNALRKLRGEALRATTPHAELLARWDQLNQVRPTVGYVGIDAHYRQKFNGWLATPTYEQLFRTHQVVVWTPPPSGDFDADFLTLRECLRQGQFVNVLGAGLGRTPIQFGVQDRTLHLEIQDREGVTVELVRDGRSTGTPAPVESRIDPPGSGLYRAQIYRHGHLWALTNPVRVPHAPSSESGSDPGRAGMASRGGAGPTLKQA